jgi:hypothetical protein
VGAVVDDEIRNELTEIELRWLGAYSLGPEDVYDARGLPKDFWQRAAKSANKPIVIGSPCRKYGHRLRTRAGHCFQCDPVKLVFQTRHSADQYVYIAGSRAQKLIKIGTSKDIPARSYKINYEQYGGASDWQILFTIRVREAGLVEELAQKRLGRTHQTVWGKYFHNNIEQTGVEMVRCKFSQAKAALLAVAEGRVSGDTWQIHFNYRYEFNFSEEPVTG